MTKSSIYIIILFYIGSINTFNLPSEIRIGKFYH